ncbi:hypothetical protein EVB32_304 [Rhizobium phage RHph_TM39]|uniref:Uncharacterized protein n=2 Tax=Cuauhnahuacvirus TaxID=3044696 RepID=A0A7S5UXU5_9CAUD|nr:hypothetical protein PQC16_gp337 [Rhizobium phage RHph_TM30]YP_010671452.1 hypothetical protein PQC17_gp338 [Rhizobium phage RHph_Y65]QIG71775.1 hypothetical protein EVB94_324 [Rhizobium phage RHph_TM40]QIG72136.1 hypothetical protein EVB95_322 [Rhizobium phage RHph_TM2_3B]QIG72498.1 hypothetical protein EVB96_322 [Rhizobium phage RHph_TM3_3_6]QIG77272.1 hypothetical protein EVB32_304 [Rhizobium phage RHph_TM39]QIG77888.1 hypothetical protein EVB64_322 [Rhizobium phage RHph_TM61]
MDQRVLDVLAQGYINRELTLPAADLSKAVIYIVNYHVRHKTSGLADLKTAYGSPESSNLAVRFYSTGLFNGVVDNDSKSSDLFWSLFNSMTTSLMIESINESLAESSKEVEVIAE